MEIESIVLHTTSEGFEYAIKFTPFSIEAIPDTINKRIVDVTIEANKIT